MTGNTLIKKLQKKQFVKVCGAFDVMSAKLVSSKGLINGVLFFISLY